MRLKLYLIAILMYAMIGCAYTPKPPEAMILHPVDVYLYDNATDLQQTCVSERWSVDDCEKILGVYRNHNDIGLHEIHCVKWDFESCGHELYHALAYRGTPPLDPDKREHFELP